MYVYALRNIYGRKVITFYNLIKLTTLLSFLNTCIVSSLKTLYFRVDIYLVLNSISGAQLVLQFLRVATK